MTSTSNRQANQVRILVLVPTYLPGFRGGGPIQSIANLVEWLGDEYSFHIIASDRDVGDSAAYAGIVSNSWSSVGKARVFYFSGRGRNLDLLRRAMRECKADLLYVNSFFSFGYSILPLLYRLFRRISVPSVVLAPRGELCPGALNLKPFKKRLFMAVARALHLHKDIVWHATSATESEDLRGLLGPKASIQEAPNLPPRFSATTLTPPPKVPGSVSLAFLSRITRKKNLHLAIDLLRGVTGDVSLSIYGPKEDPAYWALCQDRIHGLPANVTVTYCGEIQHAAVAKALANHHAFLFPTLSENFGHVILEAFLAGLVVLVSDRTPWRNLEAAGVGWDIQLDRLDLFRSAIGRLVSMAEPEYRLASTLAKSYPERTLEIGNSLLEYRALLRPPTSASSRNSGSTRRQTSAPTE